ncbi:hypothetical protein GJ744_004480 [Endocarpon pusillum]|uniref:Uncharacterized protein n=1 Tax=Endocarpon pusillum TaxID=364733 RepID=A0A8H7ARJ1_9EURO|nr:hypothetical protein GJ744_004480 [Endocarpon pusillum]
MRALLPTRPSSIHHAHCLGRLTPGTVRSLPSSTRPFTTTSPTLTSDLYSSRSNPHRAYYQTHGRALFKCLTLAFLTYQVVYWTWLTLETEEIKDQKNREIKALEAEFRLLDEGRRSHLAEGRGGKGMEEGKAKK